jgi:thiamine-monophosphate kinase
MAVTEFSIISRYFSSLGRGEAVELGVGDDCAILRLADDQRLATSMDTLVAGVHFPDDAFPEDIGYRAVAVAVSDLAAMGASPLGMTVALTLPEVDEFWLTTFSEGLARAVSEYSLPLIGGDTTKGPLSITVQVFGSLPSKLALLRSGAAAGDKLYVSGTLGDAAGGLAFIQEKWQPQPEHADYVLNRFYRPTARLQLGEALLGQATSAIDISDGLLADAGHIAAASGVRLNIKSACLPLSSALKSHPDEKQAHQWALCGGDDYELCFTLPANFTAPEGCTCIGDVTAGEGVDCDLLVDTASGYRHF